jgi:hypothetical protein
MSKCLYDNTPLGSLYNLVWNYLLRMTVMKVWPTSERLGVIGHISLLEPSIFSCSKHFCR